MVYDKIVLPIFCLILTMSLGPSQQYTYGAILGHTHFDDNESYHIVQTERGDTLPGLARYLWGAYFVIHENAFPCLNRPQSKAVIQALQNKHLIDAQGNVLPRLGELETFEKFGQVFYYQNPSVQYAIYQVLQEAYAKMPSVSPKDLQSIGREISYHSHIHMNGDGTLAPRQILNIEAAWNQIRVQALLQDTHVVGCQTLTVEGRQIDIVFIDHEDPFAGHDDAIGMVVHHTHTVIVNLYRCSQQVHDRSVKSPPETGMFNSMYSNQANENNHQKNIQLEMLVEQLESVAYHEIAHVLTTARIDYGEITKWLFAQPLSKADRKVTHEVSGILGELAGSRHARDTLEKYILLGNAIVCDDNRMYVKAAMAVIEQMPAKLNMERGSFNINPPSTLHRGKTSLSKTNTSLKNVSDRDIRQAARDIHFELFGVELPPLGQLLLPREIVDYTFSKYFESAMVKGVSF